ncbi:MAG TPA: hypothetical protein VMR81_00725 [Patescibacteria group bacterium]|nr:hypothetical protein [Patescibacteria group bacterium]
MKKLFQSPIHIFLLPLFPILSLIAHNYSELFPSQIFFAIGYVLVPVIFLWILLDLIFLKDVRKSAIAVSIAFFIFKPFASIDFLSENIELRQFIALHNDTVFWILGTIIVLAIIIKFFKRKFNKITLVLNIFSISFLILPVGSILYSQSIRTFFPIRLLHPIQYTNEGKNITTAPDIYYIISDRYANAETLSDYYGYDNSAFYNALGSRGFYVATNSAANYPFTEPSLASSLNLNYFDVTHSNKQSSDDTPILDIIENNEAVKYLKSRGYTYYHFGAEWVTPVNKNADFQYSYKTKTLSQAQIELISLNADSNALGEYLHNNRYATSTFLLSQPQNHGSYMLDQLLELSKIIANPGPKFVFVHLLLTHDPYVFTKDGYYTNRTATNLRSGANPLYLGQLQFANKILLATIDTILKSSKKPPIIILQSDEGPYPKAFRDNLNGFSWKKATIAEMREKIRILNSFYLPGQTSTPLYDNISPVNSFRMIFNLYLGEHLPLLPDKSYAQTYLQRNYDFFEVTNIVK